MAYKSDDIKHSRRQEEARGRRKPLRDLDEVEKERRFKQDILNLLKSIRNRNEFVRELRELIARYERQVGPEQYDRALQAFDEYWRKKR